MSSDMAATSSHVNATTSPEVAFIRPPTTVTRLAEASPPPPPRRCEDRHVGDPPPATVPRETDESPAHMRYRESNARAGVIGGTTIAVILLGVIALCMVLVWLLGG
jgi:hypothetical protein